MIMLEGRSFKSRAVWLVRNSTPAQVWGFALVSALVALEDLAIPFATVQPPVSEFYHRMARDPERYAVIDVAPRRRSRTLYYATIHGKPLIGGYVSRPTRASQRFLRETPVLASLFAHAPHPGPEASRRLATAIFKRYDIRYVISRHGERRGYIEDVLRLPLVFEDEGLRAYEARPVR